MKYLRLLLLAAMVVPVLTIAGDWRARDKGWSSRAIPAEVSTSAQEGNADYRQKALLVLFPGYSVALPWAQAWADALVAQNPVVHQVGEVWVFAGPDKVFYENRELPLRQSLAALPRNYVRVVVVAHSSGAFPAHLWLRSLQSSAELSQAYSGKVTYVNLDGDTGEGDQAFSESLSGLLSAAYGISVFDPEIESYSANHGAMAEFAESFPGQVSHRVLNIRSGCAKGASWCLHDVLINRRPHNPQHFDLRQDYSQFDAVHRVNVAWWPKLD